MMMKRQLLLITTLFTMCAALAQTTPNITNWLINTTGIMGRHYVQGNSTPIQDAVLANIQTVQYAPNWCMSTRMAFRHT